MKVLHLCSSYHTSKLYSELICRLNKDEYISDVFLPLNYNDNVKLEYQKYNVFKKQCFYSIDRFFYGYKQKKIFKALNCNIDYRNYDIIHAHYLFTNGNIAYKIWKDTTIPYIVAVRNTDINLFFKYRKLLWWKGVKILLNAKQIILLSESYRNKLLKYIPQSLKTQINSKIVVIPNGIDDFFLANKEHSKAINEKIVNICCVAQIDKNKNHIETIEAIKILQEKGYCSKFNIVGRIVDNAEYSKLMQNDFVEYHGVMNKEQLVNFYEKNDIFVMPSKHETFGLVYAEAISQGLPVIYTKNEGFDKQFEDGVVGYSVDCNNAQDIANKIQLVIENYDKLTSNCVECATKFDWNKIANNYIEIYDRIKE